MPNIKKAITSKYNLVENLANRYVAFIDVMGFSNLVNSNQIANLDSYFSRITEVLDKLRQDKANIDSFLISDSIILIAPDSIEDFRNLLIAVKRIQHALLWRKILMRGAVSYGPIFYNKKDNVVVGKGFIKAYLLESEACFPRVIIDPMIIKQLGTDKTDFLLKVNTTQDYTFEKRLIYFGSEFTCIPEDGIFIDYANNSIRRDEINGNMKKLYELIIENLYSEQKLYSKYIWLKNYYLECLQITRSKLDTKSTENKKYIKIIDDWIAKFKRL